MTMRHSRKLVCKCGHEGAMQVAENDSPFSSLWESHRAEGFDGEELIVTVRNAQADVLAKMNPKCPNCGESGQVKYA